jgi:hypothetical protein
MMSGMYECNAVCHMLRYHPSGTRGGRRISSSRSNPSSTTPHLAVPTPPPALHSYLASHTRAPNHRSSGAAETRTSLSRRARRSAACLPSPPLPPPPRPAASTCELGRGLTLFSRADVAHTTLSSGVRWRGARAKLSTRAAAAERHNRGATAARSASEQPPLERAALERRTTSAPRFPLCRSASPSAAAGLAFGVCGYGRAGLLRLHTRAPLSRARAAEG